MKRKTRREKRNYYECSYTEYLGHFRAMITVSQYTDVRLSYDKDTPPIRVCFDDDWEAQLLRIMDYFSQLLEIGTSESIKPRGCTRA